MLQCLLRQFEPSRSEGEQLAHIARNARASDLSRRVVAAPVPQIGGVSSRQVDQNIFLAQLQESPDAHRLAGRCREARKLHFLVFRPSSVVIRQSCSNLLGSGKGGPSIEVFGFVQHQCGSPVSDVHGEVPGHQQKMPMRKGFAKGNDVYLLGPSDLGDRGGQLRKKRPQRGLLAVVQRSGADRMPTYLTS